MMTPIQMKRAYEEHRKVEEARDLDAVVATFADNCFLENVALGVRTEGRIAVRKSYEALFLAFPDLSPTSEGFAYADNVFVTWGTVHGTLSGAWLGLAPTGRSFTCAFHNVVPFVEGKMQGEKLLFDIAGLCSQVGLRTEDVLAAAAKATGRR
jgi:predicted ester cyclase